jgi:hypothetical protein
MLHFYDGQIRRYLTQVVRVMSNFTVKYGDGTLVRVPVMYGDPDRQAATILRQNSENKVNSVPRISVYITGLDIDKERLSDASFVGNVHIREREINNANPNNPVYTTGQGRNYTVERLMPTPFKLTLKCDIWAANTEQKLQILEQILVLFNPSLELQTSDNYIDWTSLSVLNLAQVTWSNRSVPVGNDSPIDIATLTLDTPIWISPPVKVKHLGVITSIITSLHQGASTDNNCYIEGLGQPLATSDVTLSTLLAQDIVTVTEYNIEVYNNQAIVLGKSESAIPREPTLEVPVRQGSPISWEEVFSYYPRKYVAGSSIIYLVQPNGSEIVGTVAISPLDPTILQINWDSDTRSPDNDLPSPGDRSSNGGRSLGTFDAIIDPQKVYPEHGMTALVSGDRFLIVEDIIDTSQNAVNMQAWGGFLAKANDIIEWDGTQWNIIFEAAQESSTLLYQTNIYSGVQYTWNGVYWSKSFEGVYSAGKWRIEL